MTGASLRRHVPYGAVICAWTLLIYANSLDNAFHFDDLSSIQANPALRDFEALSKGLRFVTYFSFYLNVQTTGLDVTPFHVVNVLIHTLNALLVYALVMLLGRRAGIAFFAALLFALHPLNTEPVNYIVQRSILLCTFFGLLAFLLSLVAFPPAGTPRRPLTRLLLLTGAGACFVLSFLSKETGAVFPLIAFVYALFFLCTDRKRTQRTVLAGLGAAVVMAVLFSVFGVWHQLALRTPFSEPEAAAAIGRKLMTQSQAGVQYVMLALFPLSSSLNVDHDLPWVHSLDVSTVVSMAVLLLLAGGMVLSFKKHRLVSFLIAWLFLTHLPTTLFTSAEAMVEYRNYPALVAFALLLVLAAHALLPRFGFSGKATAVAGFILALGYSAAVVQRNQVWKDGLTLWQDAATKSPGKARPRLAVANHYLRNKDYPRAIKEANKAVAIDKTWIPAFLTLGIAHSMTRDYAKAQDRLQRVINAAETPLVTKRDLSTAYNHQGANYLIQKEFGQAEASLKKSIEAWPENGPAHMNFANLCFRTKRLNEGIEAIRKAIEQLPGDSRAHLLLGMMIWAQGNDEKAALQAFRTAADLDPQRARLYLEKIVARSKNERERTFFRQVLNAIPDSSRE